MGNELLLNMNTIQKQSFDSFLNQFQTLSTIQINSYLGLVLGLMPELAAAEVKTDDAPILKGEYGKEIARKDWDIKYKNSINILLNGIKERFVVNIPVINHIAREVYSQRRNTDLYSVVEFIHFECSNLKDYLKLCFKGEATEDEICSLHCRIIEGVAALSVKIKADPSIATNLFNRDYLEDILTSIMDDNTLSERVDLGILRMGLSSLFNNYQTFIRGIKGNAYVCNTDLVFIIAKILPDIMPANYKLTPGDITVITRLLTDFKPWSL